MGYSSIHRSVENNLVTSSRLPVIRLQIGPAFTYAGCQDFVLYGVAHAEQHLFVVARADRRVQRLVWVQFEAYLSGNGHTYDYSSSQQIEVAGWPFCHNADWTDREKNARERPDSDGALMLAPLRSRDFSTGTLEIFERYVTLSPDRRSELMPIYAEDAADLGLDQEMLIACGKHGEPWVSARRELHARGLASFSILEAKNASSWSRSPC